VLDNSYIFLVTVSPVLWCCWLGGRKGIRPVKNWVVGCWHGYLSGVRCRLAYGPADATVSCFSTIQIGFTFLVPAHLGSPRQRVKRVCVYTKLLSVDFSLHVPRITSFIFESVTDIMTDLANRECLMTEQIVLCCALFLGFVCDIQWTVDCFVNEDRFSCNYVIIWICSKLFCVFVGKAKNSVSVNVAILGSCFPR